MPRRPSAIAAVMSRSLSSMARSLGNPSAADRAHHSGRFRPAGSRPPPPTSRSRPERRMSAVSAQAAGRSGPSAGPASGGRRVKGKRVQAVVLAAALAVGYTGAAVYSAMAAPSLPIITDFGPGDGLTRFVLTAENDVATPDLVHSLESVDGIVTAQPLHDGRVLVPTEGLLPQHLAAVEGVGDVEFDTTVPVAATVDDPYIPAYGYHLDNTGSNAYRQTTVVPDADTDAPESWDLTTGEGMVVAVVDTGYDSDHPDMAGALWSNPAESCGSVDQDSNGKAGDCHGWNFYANNADIDNGTYGEHGTSVSGVVGARADNGLGLAGIAPDVTIMPLVIGGGSNVSVTAAVEASRPRGRRHQRLLGRTVQRAGSRCAPVGDHLCRRPRRPLRGGSRQRQRQPGHQCLLPGQPDRAERRDRRLFHRRRHRQRLLRLRGDLRRPVRPGHRHRLDHEYGRVRGLQRHIARGADGGRRGGALPLGHAVGHCSGDQAGPARRRRPDPGSGGEVGDRRAAHPGPAHRRRA